jgi:TolA-binding protein
MAIISIFFKRFAFVGLLLGMLAAPAPTLAQDNLEEARIRKIEAEIRALQRKVFPGGDARFFEPEISAAETTRATTNAPSTTAVTDILVRLDAIEAQLQRLTARSEENDNAIMQLEARIAAIEEARQQAATAAEPDTEEASEPSAAEANLAAMTGGASSGSSEEAAPAEAVAEEEVSGPSDDRLAAVQAIEKPQSDNPGTDEYTYGFRLWNAGFFPEARQQLGIYLEGYPEHELISYGRNLLGRAYLDEGMAEEAARWFLRNYQADKQGRRAGDSLLYLAESMMALGDTNRACIALAEFGETYPALASGRLQDQYEASRQKVECN